MLNKRYIKSIKRDIFVLISFPVFLFQFLFCYILERKDKKSFKRDIIVLISFLILLVSISFLVNIGKEMSLPGFRTILMLLLSQEQSDLCMYCLLPPFRPSIEILRCQTIEQTCLLKTQCQSISIWFHSVIVVSTVILFLLGVLYNMS